MILTLGMAWTQTDADAVKAAVVALATGTRVFSVSYAGPPSRTVQYGVAELPELRKLLAEILRSLNGAPRFRRAVFGKGFDPPKDPSW